jgi:hypothetical protein
LHSFILLLPLLFSSSSFIGFSGVLCQANINECASNPCQHGATCTDLINSFLCTCVPGYSGKGEEEDEEEEEEEGKKRLEKQKKFSRYLFVCLFGSLMLLLSFRRVVSDGHQ